MQKIIPSLWFDKEALEASKLYTSIFKNSEIKNVGMLQDTPSGNVQIVTASLSGYEFSLMSAGPFFKFTPAISFLVTCETEEEIDASWSKLSENGSALMELGKYPFSKKYGWLQDKYGLSWQLQLTNGSDVKQQLTPALLFTGERCGKAEEAIKFYTSVFYDARSLEIACRDSDEGPDKKGTVKHAVFMLEGQAFSAMDSAIEHGFTFNEAISFIVNCETQEEIDYYWDKLSADPKAEQCGWLKDKYGISWQIVPAGLDKIMQDKDKEKTARITQAFLKMKKIDLEELKKARFNS